MTETSDELTDQQILELTQKLKEEEAAKRPLVGPIEEVEALRNEFPQDSPFRAKITWLEHNRGLSHVRRLRGDGSCFYRATTFQLVLHACRSPDCATKLVDALKAAQKDILFAEADIVNDFAEPLYDLLEKRPLPNEAELVQAFNDFEISNSSIVFVRLIASSALRRNADEYLPFLFAYDSDLRVLDPVTGLPSVENFCANYVEAADSEADHLAIQALSKALGLKLSVAQLEQTRPGEEVDFVEMEGSQWDLGDAVLLLRPGHYDLLLP